AAIDLLRERLSATNQYFADQQPWALRKTNPERADTVLYYTAESIRRLAIMLQWVIPASCGKMLDLLAQPKERRGFNNIDDMIEPGISLPKPSAIFPRLELPSTKGEGKNSAGR
ncbi:hypothetical protein MNBD_ALPHA04-1716, partial [hydrothermal vent metagenome]